MKLAPQFQSRAWVRAWHAAMVCVAMGAAISSAQGAGVQPTAPAHAVQDAIDAQYHADRLRCAKIDDEDSRKACLKEAGAARQEAIRGQLSSDQSHDDAVLQRNALQRCTVHKDPVLRQACEGMVLGRGSSKGSVEEGGVYKEMTITLDPVPVGESLPPSSSAPR